MKALEDATLDRFKKRVVDSFRQNDPALLQFDVRESVEFFTNYGIKIGLSEERNLFAVNSAPYKWGDDFYQREPFASIISEHQGNEAVLGRYFRLWVN